jgi:hypothetical protein
MGHGLEFDAQAGGFLMREGSTDDIGHALTAEIGTVE